MGFRRTRVVIDEELLDAVRAELGTSTVKDTIEKALLEVLGTRARREEVAALSRLEGMDLDDPEVMAGAWRR